MNDQGSASGGVGEVPTCTVRSCSPESLLGLVALIMAVVACALAVVKSHVTGAPFNFAVGDGRWYTLYATSLVVDHDLDFENQMHDHWGDELRQEDVARRTPRGLVWNKYPIGLSATLLPGTWCAHQASLLLHRLGAGRWCKPDGTSVLYQLSALATVLGCAWGTMVLLQRLLVGRLGLAPRTATWAVLAVCVGSPYLYYCVRLPLVVHVVSTFWFVLTITLAGAASSAADRRRVDVKTWTGLVFAASMALVSRPTNAVLVAFLLHPLVVVWRRKLLGGLVRAVPWLAVGLLPLVAQAATWQAMFGTPLLFSYQGEGFTWGRPALLQTLFSIRRGLLVWSPLVALACAGLAWAMARRAELRRDDLLLAGLGALGALWYLNSAWWCWWFGWSFGNRAFIELTPVFVIGLALGLREAEAAGGGVRRAALAATLACVGFNLALMVVYDLRLLPGWVAR